MEASLAKSINSIKQKFEKCDEIMYIIRYIIYNSFCNLVVLILIIREICIEYIQLGVNQVI